MYASIYFLINAIISASDSPNYYWTSILIVLAWSALLLPGSQPDFSYSASASFTSFYSYCVRKSPSNSNLFNVDMHLSWILFSVSWNLSSEFYWILLTISVIYSTSLGLVFYQFSLTSYSESAESRSTISITLFCRSGLPLSLKTLSLN